MRKVMGILPTSTKTCLFFQKQPGTDNKVHNFQNFISHNPWLQEHNNLNLIIFQSPQICHGVWWRRSVLVLNSALQKEFYRSQFSLLRDPQWKLWQQPVFAGVAGSFLLESITHNASTFQPGFPFQTKQEGLESGCNRRQMFFSAFWNI